jgi:HSP20 family molecular chaperone IbpA
MEVKPMPKCPTCGNKILEVRGHELDDLEALVPAHADDQLELLITAELPGVDEKDVEVRVSGGNTLTIKGEISGNHEENGSDGRSKESSVGSFSRSIKLPFEVKEEKIDATLDGGVLTIRVQKLPEARKIERAIEVKRTVGGHGIGPSSATG